MGGATNVLGHMLADLIQIIAAKVFEQALGLDVPQTENGPCRYLRFGILRVEPSAHGEDAGSD
jgi:hypothetical protein